MVGEFPELQGLMGGKYLLAEGEPASVALAVQEHYLPRGADDALPSSDAGAVVALAERLELLLSIFAKGQRPTGSSDPYALRRAAMASCKSSGSVSGASICRICCNRPAPIGLSFAWFCDRCLAAAG